MSTESELLRLGAQLGELSAAVEELKNQRELWRRKYDAATLRGIEIAGELQRQLTAAAELHLADRRIIRQLERQLRDSKAALALQVDGLVEALERIAELYGNGGTDELDNPGDIARAALAPYQEKE